jgi:hypothetical protein
LCGEREIQSVQNLLVADGERECIDAQQRHAERFI